MSSGVARFDLRGRSRPRDIVAVCAGRAGKETFVEFSLETAGLCGFRVSRQIAPIHPPSERRSSRKLR
jgi:hypothetical protein